MTFELSISPLTFARSAGPPDGQNVLYLRMYIIIYIQRAPFERPGGSLRSQLLFACAPLIDGLSYATRSATHLSQAIYSCVIVSGFRAALDLDTYPLNNLVCTQCAKRAKRGRGKPVVIMHIGFLAYFHDISL